MVVLRRTKKLASSLAESVGVQQRSDTALGDWYVNRLAVDRKPLLLLVSSASLLAIVVPARDVRDLPARLATLVKERLRRLGIASRTIELEAAAMSPVTVGPTADRSVLGILVDFARSIPYYLDTGSWGETTPEHVEDMLAETPCYAGRAFADVVFPEQKAPALLRAKWEVN